MRLFIFLPLIVVAKFQIHKNFKHVEVTPTTHEQLQFLKDLEGKCEAAKSFVFLQTPGKVNRAVHLVVSPETIDKFKQMMGTKSLETRIINENIQEELNKEILASRLSEMNWYSYHKYDQICAWLHFLVLKYPEYLELINFGKSFENRDILGVKLSFQEDKQGVFIEGGILGNSYISPATVTYILNEFLTSKNKTIKRLAKKYDWYFLPVVNPDGYECSQILAMFNRWWMKTRSYTMLTYLCPGANANLNFKYKWNEVGTSYIACHNYYPGYEAFSEIETRSLAKFLQRIAKHLFAYISLQSYGQNLMIPYGHTREHLDNYNEMIIIAQKAALALKRRYGTRYRVGTVYETTGGTSGSSTDWVKACLELPVVVTYKMRPENNVVLDSKFIIPNGQEILESLVVLFYHAGKFGYGVHANTSVTGEK